MTYRQPQQGPRGRVTHGPFPLRLGGLSGGLICVALGILMFVLAFDDAQLTCDRGADDCRYRRSQLSGNEVHFPLSRLTGVKVDIYPGSKDNQRGRPILLLKGRPLSLKGVSVSEANRFAKQLNEALSSRADHFEIMLFNDRYMAIVALLFAGLGLWLLISSVRGIGRINYSLQSGTLHACHSIFGVPYRRWTVDVHDAERVEIAWSRIKEFWQRTGMPGSSAGRLVIHTRDGHERHVSEQAFRGYHLHRRAQQQLHELLELPPLSAATLARHNAAMQELAPGPFMGGGWGATVGLSWIGACCGSLAGIAVLGVAGISAGLFKVSDNIPSEVVIGGSLGGAIGGVLIALWLRRRIMAQ